MWFAKNNLISTICPETTPLRTKRSLHSIHRTGSTLSSISSLSPSERIKSNISVDSTSQERNKKQQQNESSHLRSEYFTARNPINQKSKKLHSTITNHTYNSGNTATNNSMEKLTLSNSRTSSQKNFPSIAAVVAAAATNKFLPSDFEEINNNTNINTRNQQQNESPSFTSNPNTTSLPNLFLKAVIRDIESPTHVVPTVTDSNPNDISESQNPNYSLHFDDSVIVSPRAANNNNNNNNSLKNYHSLPSAYVNQDFSKLLSEFIDQKKKVEPNHQQNKIVETTTTFDSSSILSSDQRFEKQLQNKLLLDSQLKQAKPKLKTIDDVSLTKYIKFVETRRRPSFQDLHTVLTAQAPPADEDQNSLIRSQQSYNSHPYYDSEVSSPKRTKLSLRKSPVSSKQQQKQFESPRVSIVLHKTISKQSDAQYNSTIHSQNKHHPIPPQNTSIAFISQLNLEKPSNRSGSISQRDRSSIQIRNPRVKFPYLQSKKSLNIQNLSLELIARRKYMTKDKFEALLKNLNTQREKITANQYVVKVISEIADFLGFISKNQTFEVPVVTRFFERLLERKPHFLEIFTDSHLLGFNSSEQITSFLLDQVNSTRFLLHHTEREDVVREVILPDLYHLNDRLLEFIHSKSAAELKKYQNSILEEQQSIRKIELNLFYSNKPTSIVDNPKLEGSNYTKYLDPPLTQIDLMEIKLGNFDLVKNSIRLQSKQISKAIKDLSQEEIKQRKQLEQQRIKPTRNSSLSDSETS